MYFLFRFPKHLPFPITKNSLKWVCFRARMSEIFEKAQVSAHEFTSEGVWGNRMPRMEARWESLGMTFFLNEHCGLFGKT